MFGSEPRADEWKRPPRGWFEAKTRFAVAFVVGFVSLAKPASRREFLTVLRTLT